MKRRAISWGSAVFLIGSALFSGCTGTEGVASLDLPSDAAVSMTPAAETSDPGVRPNWTHGDWWEFQVEVDFGFGTLFDDTNRIVVTRANLEGYDVASSGRELGVIDAFFDDFFIGPLDLDLNGLLGQERRAFRMFDWPLSQGKTWQADFTETEVRGQPRPAKMLFTASLQESVKDPKGDGPGFVVEGLSTGGFIVKFVYSPQVKWITELERKDPSGRVILSMKLVTYGTSYQGVFHQVSMKRLFERIILMPYFVFVPGTSPVPPADQVNVREDFTFLLEVVGLFTFGLAANGSQPAVPGAGAFGIGIVYPDQTHREYSMSGTGDQFKIFIEDYEPYQKGPYTIAYAGAGLGGYFVGYYAFTDVIVEFTAESHAQHGG